MVNLARFWQPEDGGQTVLPDKLILIGQILKRSNETFWVIFKHCDAGFVSSCVKIDYSLLFKKNWYD